MTRTRAVPLLRIRVYTSSVALLHQNVCFWAQEHDTSQQTKVSTLEMMTRLTRLCAESESFVKVDVYMCCVCLCAHASLPCCIGTAFKVVSVCGLCLCVLALVDSHGCGICPLNDLVLYSVHTQFVSEPLPQSFLRRSHR